MDLIKIDLAWLNFVCGRVLHVRHISDVFKFQKPSISQAVLSQYQLDYWMVFCLLNPISIRIWSLQSMFKALIWNVVLFLRVIIVLCILINKLNKRRIMAKGSLKSSPQKASPSFPLFLLIKKYCDQQNSPHNSFESSVPHEINVLPKVDNMDIWALRNPHLELSPKSLCKFSIREQHLRGLGPQMSKWTTPDWVHVKQNTHYSTFRAMITDNAMPWKIVSLWSLSWYHQTLGKKPHSRHRDEGFELICSIRSLQLKAGSMSDSCYTFFVSYWNRLRICHEEEGEEMFTLWYENKVSLSI